TQPSTQSGSVINASGASTVAHVTDVVVSCLDNKATAGNDSYNVLEDTLTNALDVTANDNAGVNGAGVDSVTQGAHGAVSIVNAGADVDYVPSADYCGSDSFTYTLVGGSTATVDVTVECVNDAPDFNL